MLLHRRSGPLCPPYECCAFDCSEENSRSCMLLLLCYIIYQCLKCSCYQKYFESLLAFTPFAGVCPRWLTTVIVGLVWDGWDGMPEFRNPRYRSTCQDGIRCWGRFGGALVVQCIVRWGKEEERESGQDEEGRCNLRRNKNLSCSKIQPADAAGFKFFRNFSGFRVI